MFIIKCYKRETGEVFRDQIMCSLDHKEFGLYPKMDGKPLKDFDQGGHLIRFFFFFFFRAQSVCYAGWGRRPREERNRSKKGIVRMPQLYSRMAATVEMERIR